MEAIKNILSRAESLRDETSIGSVTPRRVGSIMCDTLKAINEYHINTGSLILHKVYASVDEMAQDANPTSDLTGKDLKLGQMVIVISDSQGDPTGGDIYRYDGSSDNTSAWTFVFKLGTVPVDAELDATSTNPLQNKVVTEKLTELSEEKQNIIADLGAIRTGAALGATAVQPIIEDGEVYLGEAVGIVAPNDEHYYLPSYASVEDKGHAFAMLADIQAATDPLATKEYVDKAIANAGGGGGGSADESAIVSNEKVTAAALCDLDDKIKALPTNEVVDIKIAKAADEVIASHDADIEAINTTYANLRKEVINDEWVIVAALNDLKARVEDLTNRLTALEGA